MVEKKILRLVCYALWLLPLSIYASTTTHTWSLKGEAGSFAPAGWSHLEVPALTRVQAVRMKLMINTLVDERFDPVKGKKAALLFYEMEDTIEPSGLVIAAGTVLLADLAVAADIPLRIIENNNPHVLRDVLPKGTAIYGLNYEPTPSEALAMVEKQEKYTTDLAVQYERRRKQVLSFMPDPTTHSASVYVVRSGDYLGKIASRSGASVSDIRKWNKLKGNTIYPGQKLTVWKPKGAKSTTTEVASAPEKEKEKDVVTALSSQDQTFLSYEVKPGDTLWSIAQKFPGVSADNIKAYNKRDALIKAGEHLKIPTQMITDYSPEKYPGAQ
jgi:LysM repeat protein